MKKQLIKILSIIAVILMAVLFTSFAPSLDGRAVVAEEGTMPKGIFAKTVGYLPGDSISVSNLAKKATVNILVIGTLDPSEGVAILLTPEAAEMLGLDKGANSVVKITKRAGELDETVSGTAIIGTASDAEVADAAEDADDDSSNEPKEDNAIAFIAEPNKEEVPPPEPDIDEVAKDEYQEDMENSALATTQEIPIEEIEPPAKTDAEVAKESPVMQSVIVEAPKDEAPPAEKIMMTDVMSEMPEDSATPAEEAPQKIAKVEPTYESVVVAPPAAEEKPLDNRVYEPVASDKLSSIEAKKTFEPVESDDLSNNTTLPAPPAISEPVAADNLTPYEDSKNGVSDCVAITSEVVTNDEPLPPLAESVAQEMVPVTNDPIPIESEIVQKDTTESYSAISLVETALRPPMDSEKNGYSPATLDNVVKSDAQNDIATAKNSAQTPSERVSVDELPNLDANPQVSVVCNSAIVLVDNGAGNQNQAVIVDDKAQDEAANDAIILNEPNETPTNDAIVLNEPKKAEANSAIVLKEPKKVATSSERKEKPATAPTAKNDNIPSIDLDKYKVSDIAALPKGNYVQIAVFYDERNIKTTIDKYQDNYPITLVETKNKKATQVMIGPLSSDDYGAVLLRFRDYGYKDAFLRKIK